MVIPVRSPRKPFVQTQSPRCSTGSDHGGSGNAADFSPISRGKKPAWNVPSNSAIEVGSIMDTTSWPALSESARASPKSSSSDSVKALSDGSVSAPPVSLSSSPSSKQAENYQKLNSTQNSPSPRDKNMKRAAVTGVGSSGVSNVGLAMPSSLPVLTEASLPVTGKQPSLDNSPRGFPNQSNNSNDKERNHYSKSGGFSPHSHGGYDHQRNYGGGRRGSNSHHGNYGNRRDGDRGGNEWNHRNIGRGVHLQQLHQQRGVGPYPRAPSVAAAPFVAPPPSVIPFSNPMGFPAHTPQVMLFPAVDPQRAMLLKQIDYYFSLENLCKDLYLRQNMDEQGWVPISLIAGFNRVSMLETEGGVMTRGFFCVALSFKEEVSEEMLGLGFGLEFGAGLLPGEKKEVIWHCLRTRGERPLLREKGFSYNARQIGGKPGKDVHVGEPKPRRRSVRLQSLESEGWWRVHVLKNEGYESDVHASLRFLFIPAWAFRWRTVFSRERLAANHHTGGSISDEQTIPIAFSSIDRRSPFSSPPIAPYADASDAAAFLDAVDALIASLRGHNSSPAVNRSDDLLQQCMLRLEDEFRSMIEHPFDFSQFDPVPPPDLDSDLQRRG
ncbi:hypothetical protein KFK09_005664 [Dendrobium nobile]|uniref:HTH La-type RNA-binding domain-containing protein n=1 Tax=Dendrobium nobile TaxID=94219 RepID=A0A8T3C1N6_DENNO|nr:hypothetical protein KFK09_005664 [Dendrobium nobile]